MLFLSHSSTDTEAARFLKEKIENNPLAHTKKLKVWLDITDLIPGRPWQNQIERILDNESTAFAVYIGHSGVAKWVEPEVRLALSRAIREEGEYPFIPIISKEAQSCSSLPGFVKQFHAIKDPLNNPDELQKLISTILEEPKSLAPLVTDPFVGLRAFSKNDSHLFYGREKESTELIDLLKNNKLLMVYGDSGAGKSSLVKAGLIPLYENGRLEDDFSENRSYIKNWQFIEFKPFNSPFLRLTEAIIQKSKIQFNITPKDASYIGSTLNDANKNSREIVEMIKYPFTNNDRLLIVIDQFEEIFTQVKDEQEREDFFKLLVKLTEDTGVLNIKIVITMRRDYYNLCSSYEEFYKFSQKCKYLVRRMDNNSLHKAIVNPLMLAGINDADLFANKVIKDVSDRASDLALMEFALSQTWIQKDKYNGDLLKTYQSIGEVSGALAKKANIVYEILTDTEKSLCKSIFIRLAKIGDTGGSTRRIASKDEFQEDQWALLDKLSRDEFGRLVMISNKEIHEETNEVSTFIEIAHETLLTQWDKLQTWLQQSTSYIKILDLVFDRSKSWAKNTSNKEVFLLANYDLLEARKLLQENSELLNYNEVEFIESSIQKMDSDEREKSKKNRLIKSITMCLMGLAIILLIIAGMAIDQSRKALFESSQWEQIEEFKYDLTQMSLLYEQLADDKENYPSSTVD